MKSFLPLYTLFQSDRKNSDGDSEIQNPMQLAVKEILNAPKIKESLNEIASEVKEKLNEVAEKTLEKLNEMNPEIAQSLNPKIPEADDLKWKEVFKNVNISTDEGIPINKRGSGVKRLILLNFFRAEAERKKDIKDAPAIIYAVEEPETSQHPNHQRKLIDAFIELSNSDNIQIILTTHSPALVKMLSFEDIKLIKEENKNGREIINVEKNELPYPSLNEVNYLAFTEATEDYHNELYGYIEHKSLFADYEGTQSGTKEEYVRQNQQGKVKESIIKSKIIRHQIHHPENNHNKKYSSDELENSIEEMRKFIKSKRDLSPK